MNKQTKTEKKKSYNYYFQTAKVLLPLGENRRIYLEDKTELLEMKNMVREILKTNIRVVR